MLSPNLVQVTHLAKVIHSALLLSFVRIVLFHLLTFFRKDTIDADSRLE